MTARVRARGYSLEIEDPRTGATTFENHMSLAAVVTRAEMLIEAGYNIGIWSAATFASNPMAANDDVWLGALDKRLTG
jgi:hypothetical protein